MPRRTISQKELDNFEIDDENRLYWKGKEIVTTVSLPHYINLSIFVTAGANAVMGVYALIQIVLYVIK